MQQKSTEDTNWTFDVVLKIFSFGKKVSQIYRIRYKIQEYHTYWRSQNVAVVSDSNKTDCLDPGRAHYIYCHVAHRTQGNNELYKGGLFSPSYVMRVMDVKT